MNFMRSSSDTGGGRNDAVDVDAGAGSNAVSGAWLVGFFFDATFFSGMVMSQGVAYTI